MVLYSVRPRPTAMNAYHAYLRDILQNGTRHQDRTGTGTTRVFGRQLRFDLSEGFPLITTKRVWMKGVVVELLWFLSGGTNIRPLLEEGVSIWTDWPLKRYRTETGADISQDDFEEHIREDDAFAADLERAFVDGPANSEYAQIDDFGEPGFEFGGPSWRLGMAFEF